MRAAEILFDDKRTNIIEVAEPKTNMMACRPAGITIQDLKSLDMHIPDFSQRFGPRFSQQDNPADHAIIDFEYDGSYRSVVWLAHELGHAIADDVQKENGHNFRDFSPDEMEQQAYFVQHAVSQYLKNNPSIKSKLQSEDLGEDVLKMSWERASQFQNANEIFQETLAKAPDQRRSVILSALDQRAFNR